MKLFKIAFVALAVGGAPTFSSAFAQQTSANVIVPKLATKTVFAQGFGEPRGLVLGLRSFGLESGGYSDEPNGEVVLTDFQRGEVVRLDKDGKRLAILAKGLQNPSTISGDIDPYGSYLITEPKANRVVQLSAHGEIRPVGGVIADPIGLSPRIGSGPVVVSGTTSSLYWWATPPINMNEAVASFGTWRGDWKAFPSIRTNNDEHHIFRSLTHSGDTLFLTDEIEGAVWLRASNGFMSRIAKGLGTPSGLAFSPDGSLYVCDESKGGRLWKLDNHGKATLAANGLGRPFGIAFFDAKTAFVTNRDGNVWKLTF